MNHKIQKHCQRIDSLTHCKLKEINFNQIAKSLKGLYRINTGLYLSNLAKIPAHQLIYVLLELPDTLLKNAIAHLPEHRIVMALKDVESDDATDFIQRLEAVDAPYGEKIFAALHPDDKAEISELGKYPEDEAGAYMQLEMVTAMLDETVGLVIQKLKAFKLKEPNSTIQYVYVIDAKNRLLYHFNIEELLLFDDERTINEIVLSLELHEPVAINPKAPVGEVIRLFQEYDLKSIPIIDKAGRLKGRITYDDVFDLIHDFDTEQMYAMSGVDDEAEEQEEIGAAGNKRLTWLLINLGTILCASFVIGLFEETIASYVALAILLPVVAAIGGNAGMQALTVTIRRLALGEIDFSDIKEVLIREVLIVLRNGTALAVVVGLVTFGWFGDIKLGLIIAAAMFLNLLATGAFGSMIPLGLKKIGIDPAVASTVLLTTLSDIFGFFLFLGMATLFLF